MSGGAECPLQLRCRRTDYSMAGKTREPLPYFLVRNAVLSIMRIVTRLDVEGIEHIPLEGPLIIAPNHLHILDSPVVAAIIPRRQTVMAADKWRHTAAGLLMQIFTNCIFVARGEADREAMGKALAVLRAGQSLTVAPEGTRESFWWIAARQERPGLPREPRPSSDCADGSLGTRARIGDVAAAAAPRGAYPHRQTDLFAARGLSGAQRGA